MALKGNVFTVFATTLGLCVLYTSVNCEIGKSNQRTVRAVSASVPLIKGNDVPRNDLLHKKSDEIVIAFAACGNRGLEAIIMMKSALVFSRSFIRFIIVTDDILTPFFNEKMNEWMKILPNKFTFEIHQLNFPRNDINIWNEISYPCSNQSLFLPNMLPSVDALLYIDVESIILAPVEELWNILKKMNSIQFMGMAHESEGTQRSWYKDFAKMPYYGVSGLSAAVMLMNLTKMREFNWEEHVFETYKKYQTEIVYVDQDIPNIIFHSSPEKVKDVPCRYNFRADFCMERSICASALEDGVAVIHGNGKIFHEGPYQELQILYKVMTEYELGTDAYSGLFCKLKGYLANAENTPCADNYGFPLTKASEKFLNEFDHTAQC